MYGHYSKYNTKCMNATCNQDASQVEVRGKRKKGKYTYPETPYHRFDAIEDGRRGWWSKPTRILTQSRLEDLAREEHYRGTSGGGKVV